LHKSGVPKGLIPQQGTIFKILQVADAHFGEDPDGTWGPEQDKKSTKVIEAVLDYERPDLVVLSGDEITGEGLKGQKEIQKYWQRVVKPLQDRGIQWTMVLGNHDVCQTSDCKHEVQRLEKETAGTIGHSALPQIAAWNNRLNATVHSGAAPSPSQQSIAEELAEKRKKEEERREAVIEGEKKEREAEERLGKIMGKGVREIYPDDYKAEEKAGAPTEEEPSYEYAPSDTAQPGEPSAEAQPGVVPSEEKKAIPKKLQPLGAKPEGKPPKLKPPVGVPVNPVPPEAKGREDLMRYDMAYKSSWTGGEGGVFISKGGGVSNYYLRLFKDQQDVNNDKPSAILWFLDTGGGDTAETINEDQVHWLQVTSSRLKEKHGPLPGMLYMHIPSKDYLHVTASDNSCFGFEDDYITPVMEDQGLLSLLAAAEIDWLMVGHDHGNDFCCPVRVTSKAGASPVRHNAWNVHLCFGRHTGWGGYSTPGMQTRGARVLEIDLAMAKKFLTRTASAPGINSWVRLENGMVTGSSPPIPQPFE